MIQRLIHIVSRCLDHLVGFCKHIQPIREYHVAIVIITIADVSGISRIQTFTNARIILYLNLAVPELDTDKRYLCLDGLDPFVSRHALQHIPVDLDIGRVALVVFYRHPALALSEAPFRLPERRCEPVSEVFNLPERKLSVPRVKIQPVAVVLPSRLEILREPLRALRQPMPESRRGVPVLPCEILNSRVVTEHRLRDLSQRLVLTIIVGELLSHVLIANLVLGAYLIFERVPVPALFGDRALQNVRDRVVFVRPLERVRELMREYRSDIVRALRIYINRPVCELAVNIRLGRVEDDIPPEDLRERLSRPYLRVGRPGEPSRTLDVII